MKQIAHDRKDRYFKLRLETSSDLWHLNQLIDPDDLIRTKTIRTTLEGREKKPCVLKIKVEKIDYQGERLRTTGEIMEGPEDVERGYHSFNLEAGKVFELWKSELTEQFLRGLQDALRSKSYSVLVCALDRDQASISLVKEEGKQEVASTTSQLAGKMYQEQEEGKETEYYGNLAKILERRQEEVEGIVLAGPGFAKDNFFKWLQQERPQLADNTIVQDTSVAGERGVDEAIKRGAIDRFVKQSRIAKETELVEELLTRINKDSQVTYGQEEVEQALEVGAVDQLIVLSDKSKERKVRALMKKTEQKGGTVSIVHTDHEPGKKLESLGGLAALLRYDLSPQT